MDLLSPKAYQSFLASPDRLRELVLGNPGKKTIVIDEIQRVPELLNSVHQLIEEFSEIRFILTGSSARKLRRSGVDLLAGRAVLATCHPYMASELGERFDLASALAHGLVPLVYESEDPETVRDSYMTLYLREEVQAEGLARDIGAFARFLEAISFSHGSLLNVAEVARECEVSRKTVEGYVSILQDLLVCHMVPIFSRRAKRQLVKHSKFYFFDAGVFAAIRPAGPLDNPAEIGGASLEGLIFQHLLAWNEYSSRQHKVYFWRTKSGSEVDFVVYGKEIFCAIEAKNARRFSRSDLRGLKAFGQDYPEARRILLHRGEDKRLIDGVQCMPCDDFLKKLTPADHSVLSG